MSSIVTKLLHSFGVFTEEQLKEISNNFERIPRATGFCYIPTNGDKDEIHIMFRRQTNICTHRFTLNDDLSLSSEHGREFSSIDSFFERNHLKKFTMKIASSVCKVVMLTGSDTHNSLSVSCVGGTIVDGNNKTLAYFVVRTEGLSLENITKELKELKLINSNDSWMETDSKFHVRTYSNGRKFEKFLCDMKEIISGELVTYSSFEKYGLDGTFPYDEEPLPGVNYYAMWEGFSSDYLEDLKSEEVKCKSTRTFPDITGETFIRRENIDKKEFPELGSEIVKDKEVKEDKILSKRGRKKEQNRKSITSNNNSTSKKLLSASAKSYKPSD